MTADLAAPLRSALVSNGLVVGMLPSYQGNYPVFTRRPAPADAPFPLIMVSPDITLSDEDGISDRRPVSTRDISVYGSNETASHYRTVETLAYTIRDLFHRQRDAITVPGWSVVDIQARGPIPAPTEDETTIGRLVSLTIRLAKQV